MNSACRLQTARRRPTVPSRLLRSATVQSSTLYVSTGLAFMLANLVLAHALPIADYAAVTLALALVGFGGLLGPLGQERVVVRRNLAASPSLVGWGAAAASAVGLSVAAVAVLVYDVDQTTAVLLLTGSTGYGMGILAAAKFQSERRFILATLVSQGSSPLLLVTAVLLVGTGHAFAMLVTALFAAGLVSIAVASWWRLLAEAAPAPAYRVDWPETVALTGISGMAAFAATSERLVIPLALPQGALAEFAVLAALVIAPMRMLQMAVQRTLTPRLRDATSAAARRHLLLQEVGLAAGLVAVLSLALWYAAPLAVSLLLGGKYSFAPALILAALVSGAVRVVNGFSMAAVTALSPRERLHLVNGLGWLALSLVVPGAWIGAAWGLTGLLLGISAAWLCQAAVLLLLVLPSLRSD